MRSDLSHYASPLYQHLLEGHLHLYKTLQSHALGDRSHLSVDLVDGEGRVRISSSSAELSNAGHVARSVATRLPDLRPGDVVVTNDPYAGSLHIQDHWIVAPVFDGDQRSGSVLAHAHLADVGGRSLGNFFPGARDLWQEGVRTTPVRLYRDGQLDTDVLELIKLNSRLPIVIEHDLLAMVAVAEGLAGRLGIMKAELDDLQTLSRAALDDAFSVSNGSSAEDSGNLHDCHGSDPAISLEVRVENGGLLFDFSGTVPQVEPGFLNSTFTNTESYVADVVANRLSGVFSSDILDAIRIVAPERSLVNCSFPLPVGWSPYEPKEAIAALVGRCLSDLGIGNDYEIFKDDWRPPLHIAGCRRKGCPF